MTEAVFMILFYCCVNILAKADLMVWVIKMAKVSAAAAPERIKLHV